MRNNKSSIKILSFFIFFFIFVFLGTEFLSGADQKNFYFPELRADLYIQKDGSFQVDEFLTFEFKGEFSWASIWIPLSARRNSDHSRLIEITDFRVQDEKGKELPVETAISQGQFQARWSFRAVNESRTFHLSYRVNQAILNYGEISELYWQVIGSQVNRPTARAEVTVHLPEKVKTPDEVLIYGHGPLSGKSEIVDGQTFRFKAANIRAGQFFEIRVVWPAGLVNGVQAEGYTKEKIKEEEAEYVRKTIEAIKKEQRKRENTEKLARIGVTGWIFWQIIGPLIWLILYLIIWEKIGKDYRFNDIPEYFRQIPSDLCPALVQVLRREGEKAQPVAFTATIFDLARRGYMEIKGHPTMVKTLFGQKIKEETLFVLKKPYRSDVNLKKFEKQVLEFIFDQVGTNNVAPGTTVQLDDIVNYLKKVPAEFQSFFRSWTKEVDQEAKKLGFIEPASLKAYNLFLIFSLVVAILSLSPVLFILSLLLSPRLKRRRRDWARENELWKALERFLHDFSDFQEIPPEAYKLWDQYLVFAILFGQAKKLTKMLPLILQNSQATNTGWIAAVGASSFNHSSNSITSIINSIERAAAAINQAGTQAAHYSSGGGGGFSGGGGGGGGGGGVSAG
ncbi:MAG: DUF2207 family protein [Candidatus Saccharicenans sp.]